MKLIEFSPDNHFSDDNILLFANKDKLGVVKAIIKSEYAHLSLCNEKIYLVKGYNINSLNYRVGDYFLKILNEKQFNPKFYFFHKIITEMKKQEIPCIEFLKNCSGSTVSEISFRNI